MRYLLLLIVAVAACSKPSPIQKGLDAYFGKGNNGYRPIAITNVDTVTMEEQREFELSLAELKADPKLHASMERLDSVYVEMINKGFADEFIMQKYRKNSDARIQFIRDAKTRDSIQSLIGGFDKDLPYRIQVDYNFLMGTDTMNYAVYFDKDLSVIDAVQN